MSIATLAKPLAPTGTGWEPFRWTIAQYRDLGKTGFFDNVKTMLINGEIFTMVMPRPPHDTALALTLQWLQSVFGQGYYIRGQMGFDIGLANDPGPDIAVVTGSIRDYATQTPTTAVLVVEVSDSTLAMDTTTKAELYATAGVADYWVVDLVNRQVHIFRGPQPLPSGLGATAYRTHKTFGPTDQVSPLAAPGASITVSDLLP
jgi:Uma2 family endonuclease